MRHKQLQFGVNTVKDDKLIKFYSGLTRPQFNHLFNSLGDSVNGLIYSKGNRTSKSKIKNSTRRGGIVTKLSSPDQVYF